MSRRVVPLYDIAHGRAGDKGNVSNISVIAFRPADWPILVEQVTADRVLKLFRPLGASRVERFELATLCALNFVIHDTLDGGVNASLGLDRHGKCLSFKLLGELMVDIDTAAASGPRAPGT
ncbi:MAG: hypothetical protein AAF317_18560 [Pseudomonadota bacterium]